MPNNKIGMTPEQASLFKELQKLAKTANQRILRLERETGVKEGFAAKQLSDYLSSKTLNAWTKSGRVGVSKKLDLTQMKAINKAINNFLKEETSRVKGVKQALKRENKAAGININYKQFNVVFQARKNYSWIYQYMTPSEFWGAFVPEAKQQGWGLEEWTDNLMVYITDRTLDEDLQADIKALYEYAINGE